MEPRAAGTWIAAARGVGATPVVHYLDVPVDVAVSRALGRRGSDPFSHELDEPLDEAGVRHLAAILEAPTAAEGAEVVLHHCTPGRSTQLAG
ncbi:MAG: hypothetical protein QOK43_1845 [Acidimicrobiaceae bacterium]|nr:hypothetical protein [Acidimicrobiaceae bacterium]